MDETIARIGAIGLLVGHSLLALSVTVHVLLQKRDVGAAIGWIGLAWLSPILGSILYALFGINRVRQRGNQLRDNRPAARVAKPPVASAARDDHLAPLVRAGDRITQRAAESSKAVSVLHNGDETYPRMIAAIEAAKDSVALSTYIFRADAAGVSFIDQLIAAHRRGVVGPLKHAAAVCVCSIPARRTAFADRK
jgi:cardiolipin synthase